LNARGARRWTPDAGAAIPIGLTVAAYVLALVQRVGLASSDTKINLHVDPTQFLGQAAAVWNRSGGLGHVQSGQYPGYLWPMGPFFAMFHLVGISDWVCQRVWLGTLLALAAWGTVRLMDALYDRRRGIAHLLAGAVYLVNPYVVVMASRTTIFLLAYAALPWLLLVTYRGLHEPRRWWWPAAFALLFTSTAGGVNATVSAFVLLGPAVFVLYEAAAGGAPRSAVLGFIWRAAVATVASALWWVIPLLVQSSYGTNFLQFTEPVGAIWSPTSLTESLRLMGYWPTYLGVGFASHLTPYFGNAETMLFNPAVVAASLLVPGLALAGYAVSRRWRYASFFLLLAVVALVAMTVGWPPGTPGRRTLTVFYRHLSALQFLRTTYKAGPLLALSLSALAGSATAMVWRSWPRAARLVAGPAAAALIVLTALPLFQGRGLELTWKRVPAAWREVGRDLNRRLPANARAMVLPGQEYAYYTWGATIDPILSTLTTRPVAIRNVPPFDDLHAVDLLWTVDDLVQQDRLLPGQLRPLLDLMSVRSVVVGTDDDRALSGAVDPAVAAQQLSSQPGFVRPTRSYGPVTAFPGPADGAQPPVRLPQVRRYDLRAPGLVRLDRSGPVTMVEGSGEGLAGIAALNGLPRSGPLFYAGDETAGQLRRQALAGAQVIITDSNRRRVFVPSRVRQNYGWTISSRDAFPPDSALLDPFRSRGSAAQTVAVYQGARDIVAPYNPQLAQFPEHRPYAAFDRNTATSWLADPTLDPSQQWIQIDLDHPRDIPRLGLLPYQMAARALQVVSVNGKPFRVRPGWNDLPVGLHHVRDVRIAITKVVPSLAAHAPSVGLAEVQIPGVRVRELLRVPVLAEQELRGVDLGHTPLSYVFERTTAAAPLRRGPRGPLNLPRGDRLQQESALIRQAQDPESGIARQIDPPAPRSWVISGLAGVSPTAPDPALDRLAGTDTHSWTFFSSGRLQGVPGLRASAAFDGSRVTSWAAPFEPSDRPWIGWRSPSVRTVRRLRLVPGALPVGLPSRVTVASGSQTTPALTVGRDGAVVLPAPLTGRSFRVSVLATTGSHRSTVGIAEVLGSGAPAAVTPAHAVRGRCGDLVADAGSQPVALRLHGSVSALNAGQALNLEQCGSSFALPARATDILVPPRVFAPLFVQLHSPAPDGALGSTPGGGTVLNAGDQTAGSYTGIRVAAHGPSWLVLGESYNRGWRATCSGRPLGAPRIIDAFANGWPIDSRCHDASITFEPKRVVDYAYLAGGLACLALLLVLLLRRPRSPLPRLAARAVLPESSPAWPVIRALAAGLAAAAIIGFIFGLRAGAVAGPAFALVLWRGTPTIRLLQLAGALLGIVVVLYLGFPGRDQGGYDDGYAGQHLAAHWVAVGALALLALSLIRDLIAVSRATRRRRADPTSQRAPASRPRARA
jgi:arabinofuranan 3-O-arabinosyltransferase